jgi:hypothetical protein
MLNLILILFKLRVGISDKEYPEYDLVRVLIIFWPFNILICNVLRINKFKYLFNTLLKAV